MQKGLRREYILSTGLFNLYSEPEVLPGFIIVGQSRNNKYTDGSILMTDTEWPLLELISQVV